MSGGPASAAGQSPFSPIEEILADLRLGRMIVLVDDECRENEGDLVCPAQSINPEKVNFMLRFARGTLCVALTQQRCRRLHLTPQVTDNTTRLGTNFTITVDAGPQLGTTTGVSAFDRAATIRHLVAEEAVPEDFVRPGHVNPLTARDGGVLVRGGQTEGSVDLCRLAGMLPGAALIEILNDDGTMARVPQLIAFCRQHGLKMCTIADLIEYRLQRERLVERVEQIPLKNEFGDWRLFAYRARSDAQTHVALCRGGVGEIDAAGNVAPQPEPVLVRVHSECLTGDVFGSFRCECGEQLGAAMAMIAREGRGALVYLRQEGRGIGLENKLHAYRMQDQGLDTVQANEVLGFRADQRDYGIGAQILRDLGLQRIRILTNNPKKVSRLAMYGLEITEQLPLEIEPNEHNRRYLETKKYKLGHQLRKV
ncbi:MAG: GTP cyclohydrolase II [Phycisphaerales bacterium]|nr:GTP cyclohydrolase II [Phycisphaerales bacterium]